VAFLRFTSEKVEEACRLFRCDEDVDLLRFGTNSTFLSRGYVSKKMYKTLQVYEYSIVKNTFENDFSKPLKPFSLKVLGTHISP